MDISSQGLSLEEVLKYLQLNSSDKLFIKNNKIYKYINQDLESIKFEKRGEFYYGNEYCIYSDDTLNTILNRDECVLVMNDNILKFHRINHNIKCVKYN